MKKILLTTLVLTALSAHADSFDFNAFDQKGVQIIKGMDSDMNMKAMVNDKSTFINSILNLKKESGIYASTASEINDPYDTHIHHTLSEIRHGFAFKPAYGVPVEAIIGYTPIGTYDENGWTGVKEFFELPQTGPCEYWQWHVQRVGIDAAKVSHDVNGHIGNTDIEGNDKIGYLYRVSWFVEQKDQTIMVHDLYCAGKKYDKSVLQYMRRLAIETDKYSK